MSSSLLDLVFLLRHLGLLTLIELAHVSSKTLVVMVGLPAAGKLLMAQSLAAHLEGCGLRVGRYNAGNTRRRQLGLYAKFTGEATRPTFETCPTLPVLETTMPERLTGDFFSAANAQATHLRNQWATATLLDLLADLTSDSVDVGVFDATNSTQSRRESVVKLAATVAARCGVEVNVVIVTVATSRSDFMAYNVGQKAHNPDYEGNDAATAVADFVVRLGHYRDAYEPVAESECEGYASKYGPVEHVVVTDLQHCVRRTHGKGCGVGRAVEQYVTSEACKHEYETYREQVAAFMATDRARMVERAMESK